MKGGKTHDVISTEAAKACDKINTMVISDLKYLNS